MGRRIHSHPCTGVLPMGFRRQEALMLGHGHPDTIISVVLATKYSSWGSLSGFVLGLPLAFFRSIAADEFSPMGPI